MKSIYDDTPRIHLEEIEKDLRDRFHRLAGILPGPDGQTRIEQIAAKIRVNPKLSPTWRTFERFAARTKPTLFDVDDYFEHALHAAAQLIHYNNTNTYDISNKTDRPERIAQLAWCIGTLEARQVAKAAIQQVTTRQRNSQRMGLSKNAALLQFRINVCTYIRREYPAKKYTESNLAGILNESRDFTKFYEQQATCVTPNPEISELARQLTRWRQQSGSKEILSGFFSEKGKSINDVPKAGSK
jgi:hypothetical protein